MQLTLSAYKLSMVGEVQPLWQPPHGDIFLYIPKGIHSKQPQHPEKVEVTRLDDWGGALQVDVKTPANVDVIFPTDPQVRRRVPTSMLEMSYELSLRNALGVVLVEDAAVCVSPEGLFCVRKVMIVPGPLEMV